MKPERLDPEANSPYEPQMYQLFTLSPDATMGDWLKEQLWANDPDPREDLIHPFVD
jgi:hypothetical protein